MEIWTRCFSEYRGYSVETNFWKTYWAAAVVSDTCPSTAKHFEVVLGKSTLAKIGWIGTAVAQNGVLSDGDNERSVGCIPESINLDCARGGISTCGTRSTHGTFADIDGLASIGEGTVVRCECTAKGHKWYVNGCLVTLADKDGNQLEVEYIYPCFSVKGTL